MIKSNIKIWMFGCIGLLGLNGCNDSFLERYPETSITVFTTDCYSISCM